MNRLVLFISVVFLCVFSGCQWLPVFPSPQSKEQGKGKTERGLASYYADKYHGRPTASGEIYNRRAMTAAHRTLPFGTRVRVTNQRNRKSVVVRINDRGPFVQGRIIDLSRAAAESVSMIRDGVVEVTVEILR
jgi:rare lipoprotein A